MYTSRFNVTPNRIVLHTADNTEIAQHVNNTVNITLENVSDADLVQLISQFMVPVKLEVKKDE